MVVCAVLFGCDESFIGLDLGKGYSIVIKSLLPVDGLMEIFSLDAIDLRYEYEEARLNKDNLNVACIYQEFEYSLSSVKADEEFNMLRSEILSYIDDQVRIIRLLIEGPVRFKKLAIKMKINNCADVFERELTHFALIPIGEAYYVETYTKSSIENQNFLSQKIQEISLPIINDFVNQAHLFYDRSYLVTIGEAEILLISALEILYLESEKCIKECLAKRCSVFLSTNEEERKNKFIFLKKEYEKRCEYVHDGNANNINIEGILFLRDCVRKSILKMIESPTTKKTLIRELREKVSSIQVW